MAWTQFRRMREIIRTTHCSLLARRTPQASPLSSEGWRRVRLPPGSFPAAYFLKRSATEAAKIVACLPPHTISAQRAKTNTP